MMMAWSGQTIENYQTQTTLVNLIAHVVVFVLIPDATNYKAARSTEG